MHTNLPPGVPRCHHIKVNGTRCDSPALKGKAYCYFHFRARLHAAASAPPMPTAPLANDQRLTPNGLPLLSPPADLFLLEDANSIHCALQWVLRRILDASMDHRQASLLLYGLQIAAANIKNTRFQPFYTDVIRTLPDTPQPTAATIENPPQSAQNSLPCHPELTDRALAKEHNEGPAVSPAIPTPAPSAPPSAPLPPTSLAEAQEPAADSPKLPTERPLATAPPKRPGRRPRTAPLATDHRSLTTARSALSLMFQREVRRHLDRLNFPVSPESNPET